MVGGVGVPYNKDQLRDERIGILNHNELHGNFEQEAKTLVREEFGWDEVVRRAEKV